MYRYAIYYAPPRDSLLWRTGTAWLGRDPESGAPVASPAVAGYTSARLQQLTASARRYGFHATLKAPFRLRPECGTASLQNALAEFSASCAPVELPPLEVALLGRFIALRPTRTSEPLQRFAQACVEHFDPFRMPLSEEDLARRRSADLTASQLAALSRYGYPYVGADFRFHVTLTDRLDEVDQGRLLPFLRELFAGALGEPTALTEVALFGEAEPGSSFILLRRFPMGTA